MTATGRLALSCATLVAACGGGRDVVPESRDVQDLHERPRGELGYEYVARRPLGAVAVAESRGLPADVVRAAADRLANSLDVCATRLAADGRLVPAAARVAAHIDRSGAPVGLALTLTPGPGPTANALLCFVSPFKLVRFPAADPDAGDRGIAIEASWGAPAAPTAP